MKRSPKPKKASTSSTRKGKKHERGSEREVFEFSPLPLDPPSDKRPTDEPFAPTTIIAQIQAHYKHLYISKAYALVELAVGIIRELERLAKEDPHGVRSVAEHRVTWPVLAGRHSATQKKNEALLERLELGKSARIDLDLREVPINLTPAKKWALELVQLVEKIRFSVGCSEVIFLHLTPEQMTDEHLQRLRNYIPSWFTQSFFSTVKVNWVRLFEIGQLPELAANPESIQLWHNAIWNLLLLNSNDHPEEIPELCALGEHRRFHPYAADVEIDFKRGLVTLDQQKINISREIRDILKDEVRKLAGQLQKIKPPTE